MHTDFVSKLKASVDITDLISEFSDTIWPEMLKTKVEPDANSPLQVQFVYYLKHGDRIADTLEQMPKTKNLVESFTTKYGFNTVVYRCIFPNTCYEWHTDYGELCMHIPLLTNKGCRFVYEDRCFKMPGDGAVYIVNNGKPHTFMNAGSDYRTHLILENNKI